MPSSPSSHLSCPAFQANISKEIYSEPIAKEFSQTECPLFPPSSGTLCVPPSGGAHNCSYNGGSGNTYQLESPLVINCCCGQCDTDMTCSPDSISGSGRWQPVYTSLCPDNGCGTEGNIQLLDVLYILPRIGQCC